MAATISSASASPLPGGQVMVAGFATLSANYQSAGEVLNLSAYILSTATPIVTTSGDDGYVAQHNRGTSAAGALQMYEAGADAAALDEVGDGTDLSAVIVPFIAIGQSA